MFGVYGLQFVVGKNTKSMLITIIMSNEKNVL